MASERCCMPRSSALPAGDSFSIADIASMPYLHLAMPAAGGGDLVAKYPNVQVPCMLFAARCRASS